MVNNPIETTLWSQGWFFAQELGLNDEMSQGWESFLTKLKRAHIRLSGDPDDLVWAMNTNRGDYTMNLDYLSLQSLSPASHLFLSCPFSLQV